jgi:hypothetical protein
MWLLIPSLTAMAALIGFQLWTHKSPWRREKNALIDAIGRNDLNAVREIVGRGRSLNFNYWSHGCWLSLGSPLSLAVFKKNRSIADFLIANGASWSPRSPGNGALLRNAVRGGHLDFIDSAMAAGHEIHFKTLLSLAIHEQRSLATARHLVSKGAVKEDVAGCQWFRMDVEMILFIHELGVEVPQNVLDAVRRGDWRLEPAVPSGNGGAGG